ncbi:MAG: M23 family metallopeptidase, partial [Deinococcota bacterium]
ESRFDARSGWGWTVLLEHEGGWRTRYSHNSANVAQVGEQVRGGQLIARVGSTGRSTGPHVDYRVYVAGVAVDPLALPPGPSALR